MKHLLPEEVVNAGRLECPKGFGLYLHWPFCQAKCPYCDFNSHVSRDIDQPRWAAAFEREIERAAEATPQRVLDSIYFGGGTPSLMSPQTVDRILGAARRAWEFNPEIEITLEANPSSVETERLRGFIGAGVNRISVGVQALSDADLKALGRLHSARDACEAVATAQALARRVSFDLIYARQGQSCAAWREELKQALAMAPDHLSLYQLTVEEGTVFGARQELGKLRGLPDADLAADLYELTQELCEAAGLQAYEVSNHARPGAESRHNLIYWRSGDYLGLGPGAHGRLTLDGVRFATRAEPQPALWLEGVEGRRDAQEGFERVSRAEQGAEYLMMAMRLREGASLSRYEALSGAPLSQAPLEELGAHGLLWQEEGRIGATPRGTLLLNAILRELV